MSLDVTVLIDAHAASPLDADAIVRAVRTAAMSRGFRTGEIGVRITDDATIHQVNRDHLHHDYPTDVISFGYRAESPAIEGEMIASAQTARCQAAEHGWNASQELLLYVVHGTLHLTGLNDGEPADRSAMRAAEAEVLTALGVPDVAGFNADTPSVSFATCERSSRQRSRRGHHD